MVAVKLFRLPVGSQEREDFLVDILEKLDDTTELKRLDHLKNIVACIRPRSYDTMGVYEEIARARSELVSNTKGD